LFNKGLVSVRRQSNFPLITFLCTIFFGLFSRETRTSGHFNANFRSGNMSTDHMAAASSDFDIFNLFDTDDIELSQLCEKMDTENNLINTADIKTINFNDLDFLSSDIDDLTLSQICDTIETEYHMTNELNSLKIDKFGDFEIETQWIHYWKWVLLQPLDVS